MTGPVDKKTKRLPSQNKISRFKEVIRYESHGFLVFRIMTFFLSPLGFLGMMRLYEKDLTAPLKETEARIDISISQATLDQLENISHVHRSGEREERQEEFERYFNDGHLCFIAKIDSQIVNYNWTCLHSMPSPIEPYSPSIPLMADEAFCQTAFTVEKWRGQNIHAEVLNHMLRFMKDTGFRKAYTAVDSNNRSSFKAHERTGWDLGAIILYFVFIRSNRTFIWKLRGNRNCAYLKKILSAYSPRNR